MAVSQQRREEAGRGGEGNGGPFHLRVKGKLEAAKVLKLSYPQNRRIGGGDIEGGRLGLKLFTPFLKTTTKTLAFRTPLV